MNIDDLHPELHKVYGRIPAVPFHNPIFRRVANAVHRLRPNRIRPFPGVVIQEQLLKDGSVRIYQPQAGGSGAGLMWIHGGGYNLGDASINDRECSAIARELGLVVVSVNYRLAPKYPFPAALDDCQDAWAFMLSKADDWNIDRERIAILGQSAGGGLAAAVVQRIADTAGIQPAAQLLLYAMMDDRTAALTELDGIKHRLWNNQNNRGGWRWYLGLPPGQYKVPPYAVPARREDLSGLPPAWVGVGEMDLFVHENRSYARGLKAAGVACELYLVPRAPHAFDLLVPDASISQAWFEAYCEFLRKWLQL